MRTPKHSSVKGEGGVPHSPFSLLFFWFPSSLFSLKPPEFRHKLILFGPLLCCLNMNRFWHARFFTPGDDPVKTVWDAGKTTLVKRVRIMSNLVIVGNGDSYGAKHFVIKGKLLKNEAQSITFELGGLFFSV